MKRDKENLNQSEEIIETSEKKKKKFSLKNLTFYTNKRFYTILIIVFSVLLAATIVTGPLVRMRSALGAFSSMGGFGSISTDVSTDDDTQQESSSDDDSSDDASDDSLVSGLPDTGSSDSGMSGLPSGSLPDSSSDSSSSEGDFSFDEAESFDISEIESGDMVMGDSDLSGDVSSDDSSSDDSSEISGLPSGDFTDVTTASSGGGFISWYASAWHILALIFLVLDIASIVCRITTGKRQKREEKEAAKEKAKEEGRIYIDRTPAKKEKNARTGWIIPLAVVIAIVLVVNLISSGSTSTSAQTSASDLSATVETGTISQTVPGAGTLEAEDAVEISYADGVTVTKWYVSNGDTVSEGDLLAKVDKTSVLSTIASVQEAIETLDEEIASHEDDEISDTLSAASDGKVMAVYASEDTSVVDTMYEYGALMIISLDGLLAVDIETDSLSRGDTVTLTDSDGNEEEGSVESVTGGVAVITVSDDFAGLGEEVTVTDSDGNEAGSGTLYVHSALKVTGFSGTVSSISVSVGDEVSSGDTLISLEDTDYTAEYEALIEEREVLSDQMGELFKLYMTGYLYASADGIISGVDESLKDDSSEDDASSDTSSDDTASADSTSLEVSSEEITVTTLKANAAAVILLDDSSDKSTTEEETEEDDEEDDDDSSGSETDSEDDTSESIVGYITEISSSEDGTYVSVTISTLDGEEKTVEINSDRSVYTFADSGFAETDFESIETGYIIFYFSDDTMPIYAFSLTSDNSDNEDDTDSDDSAENGQENQNGSDGSGSDNTDSSGGVDTQSQTLDDTSSEDQLSNLTDSTEASDLTSALTTDTTAQTDDDSTTTQDVVTATYSISETVLCSITPQDYMTVEITVDELDILSLSVGQSAVVTLDAYTGQSFEGEVISVSLSPSNSGGNSKYTAVIQIEKTEDMLAGMNASVSITVGETQDVLVILADAVFEENGAYYVYTSFDEKSGTYSGAVEVTLGTSDGEYIEVTDGLSEGDTYYYSYLDTVNYSSTIISGSGSSLFSVMQ